jgi:tetratricopeptide (TPR) repeat protein
MSEMDDAAYLKRGNEYFGKGDYDHAIADYSKAISLNPDNIDAYGGRGNTYSFKGDSDSAIADYSQAISLDPNYATGAYYGNRAQEYLTKGDFAPALADFEQLLRFRPSNNWAKENIDKLKAQGY